MPCASECRRKSSLKVVIFGHPDSPDKEVVINPDPDTTLEKGSICSCSPLWTLEITKWMYRIYDPIRGRAQISWCPLKQLYCCIILCYFQFIWFIFSSDLFLSELIAGKAEHTL